MLRAYCAYRRTLVASSGEDAQRQAYEVWGCLYRVTWDIVRPATEEEIAQACLERLTK